ncbi:MAG: flagellar biosynthetic protein FliR [Candidatus Tectomicrobia bacterium]|uniref:Flagellar biosynthetic protein FliR n=1 Tax=Tectimicrobiota bacterium TaxID=2528274 RepID=A0A932FZH1_UNCTE|nr:flagellar biosynthetic protein FliR [Candidatus Tectomicrobia bacterium]
MELPLELTEQFLMVFFRVSSFLFLVPLFGSPNLPAMLKIGLAFALTLVFVPILPPPTVSLLVTGPGVILALGRELLIGGALALAVKLIFAGVELAGQILGYQMGFSIMNVIDPQTSEQVSVLGQFQNFLALMIFLAIDGHHLLIRALMHSFQLVSPLEASFSNGLIHTLTFLSSQIFVLAIKISAPAMIAVFLANLAMGLMARLVPQMNVFMLNVPLTIALGFLVIGLSLPFFAQLLVKAFHQLEGDLYQLLRTMAHA